MCWYYLCPQYKMLLASVLNRRVGKNLPAGLLAIPIGEKDWHVPVTVVDTYSLKSKCELLEKDARIASAEKMLEKHEDKHWKCLP
ncbi:hypothetical protein NPIL_674011 [Nephila pilipes]|uniref:Uncharacterized protein n=1 Tax=Nephila pilipes TaxID=299642 RepID=A0A8X6QT16_NEPPI|nr:hypothetical protein NPIL_674011 [Nephila pilipes]